MTGVNVYTEWGRLKEIIIGTCANTDQVSVDVSFRLFYHVNIKDVFLKNSYCLQKKLIEERQEDLDDLQSVLEKMGIIVKRPRKLQSPIPFKTPQFKGAVTSVNNPRDQVLIAGDEIIETSCVNRNRYFENDLMKDIFREYFMRGSRWTCSPRPIMKDESFDYSTVQQDPGKMTAWDSIMNKPEEHEIMFDGAQCLKFGKNILMNVSNTNHELGFLWLKRHLEGRFTIHKVSITEHHIDGMLMPLRPGVLLINPRTMHDKLNLLPTALQKWDLLTVPEEDRTTYPDDAVLLASSNINVNVLPIDGDRVIVFDQAGTEYNALVRTLERKGFTPIPVRLRHSRLFDGGAHCATLDMVREDSPEDFFS